jgi:NAD(P)-dependent dehydrogenase (short-subunit alcohol dehydrogenase family)
MNLHGRTCLITGGTKGIGAAIALAFAADGANVCVNGRHNDKDAEEVLDRISKAGGRGQIVVADVAKPAEAVRCVEEAIAGLGIPDVLVHCAGAAAPGGLLSVTPEQWYAAFDLHIHPIFHLCRTLVPAMTKEKREGAIVLVGSAAGLRGCLNALAYGAVKGALPQLTRTLARELGDSNIRVNCVAPGVIRTRFQDVLTPAQMANNVQNRIPLHREGTPEQVAEAVKLLVTNDYITGETLTIDGGLTMRIA